MAQPLEAKLSNQFTRCTETSEDRIKRAVENHKRKQLVDITNAESNEAKRRKHIGFESHQNIQASNNTTHSTSNSEKFEQAGYLLRSDTASTTSSIGFSPTLKETNSHEFRDLAVQHLPQDLRCAVLKGLETVERFLAASLTSTSNNDARIASAIENLWIGMCTRPVTLQLECWNDATKSITTLLHCPCRSRALQKCDSNSSTSTTESMTPDFKLYKSQQFSTPCSSADTMTNHSKDTKDVQQSQNTIHTFCAAGGLLALTTVVDRLTDEAEWDLSTENSESTENALSEHLSDLLCKKATAELKDAVLSRLLRLLAFLLCGCDKSKAANIRRNRVYKYGLIHSLVTLLHSRVAEAGLVHRICGLLWNFLRGDQTDREEKCDALLQEGCLDVMSAALEHHKHDPRVSRRVLEVLWDLADESDTKEDDKADEEYGCTHSTGVKPLTRRQQVGMMSNFGTIIDVMRLHARDAILSYRGCGLLWDLTAGSSAISEQRRNKIVSNGGIAAILGVMDCHQDKASVAETGAWALRNLAGGCEQDADVRCDAIISAGAVSILISLIEKHCEDCGVVESACGALWNLVGGSSPRVAARCERIVSEGGIETVLRALTRHNHDSGIAESACGTLWGIASGHGDAVELRCNTIVKEGGVEAVLQALRLHTVDASVVEAACGVLWGISSGFGHDSECRRAVIEACGGFVDIIDCLKRYKENPSIVECTTWALCNLTCDIAQVSEDCISQSQDTATDTMGDMLSNRNHLATQDRKKIVMDCDGISSLLEAMDNHIDRPQIVQAVCQALRYLISNQILFTIDDLGRPSQGSAYFDGQEQGPSDQMSQVVEMVISNDGVRILMDAFGTHQDRADLLISINGALQCLIHQQKSRTNSINVLTELVSQDMIEEFSLCIQKNKNDPNLIASLCKTLFILGMWIKDDQYECQESEISINQEVEMQFSSTQLWGILNDYIHEIHNGQKLHHEVFEIVNELCELLREINMKRIEQAENKGQADDQQVGHDYIDPKQVRDYKAEEEEREEEIIQTEEQAGKMQDDQPVEQNKDYIQDTCIVFNQNNPIIGVNDHQDELKDDLDQKIAFPKQDSVEAEAPKKDVNGNTCILM